MKGWFENRRKGFGVRINVNQSHAELFSRVIREQKLKIVCLNDNELLTDFEDLKHCAQDTFSKILPERSG